MYRCYVFWGDIRHSWKRFDKKEFIFLNLAFLLGNSHLLVFQSSLLQIHYWSGAARIQNDFSGSGSITLNGRDSNPDNIWKCGSDPEHYKITFFFAEIPLQPRHPPTSWLSRRLHSVRSAHPLSCSMPPLGSVRIQDSQWFVSPGPGPNPVAIEVSKWTLFAVCFDPYPHILQKIKCHKEVTKGWKLRFFLLFLLDDGRIWIRIRTSDWHIGIRETEKLTDPDTEHCPVPIQSKGILSSDRKHWK